MDIVPVTDEQAKAIAEAFKFGSQSLETARKFGGFLAKALGTVPEDLVGLLGGDWIRYRRAEQMVRLTQRAQALLADRSVDPEPVSLALAIPLLEAAADESRPELAELWARLLAAAMDPDRSKRVRQTFVETIKAFDPVDALVLRHIVDRAHVDNVPTHSQIAHELKISTEEADVSLGRLLDLRCIRDRDHAYTDRALHVGHPILTSFGTELLRVLEG